MKHSVILCLAGLILTGSAFGAYRETFTGGFDLGLNPVAGGWQFTGLQPSGAAGGSYMTETTGNYLRITTDAYPSTGAAEVVGVVPAQMGTDFYMSAVFNLNQLAYPDDLNDSREAIMARANLTTGNAYAVSLDRGWGQFQLAKTVGGVYTPLGTPVNVFDFGHTLAENYFVDFRVEGSTVAFSLFDGAGNFIAGRSVPDSDITGSGYSGLMTALNTNINPKIPGTTYDNPYYVDSTQYPTLDNATFDNVFMTRVAGDANFDGRVTFEDFSALQNNYNQSGKRWGQGDFTGDGQVNFEDFSVLQNHYGSSAGQLTVGQVPEPITLILLGMGSLFLRRRA